MAGGQGYAGSRRRDVALTVLLSAAAYATYLIYPALNHGPNRIFLRTGLDRAIPLVPVMVVPYVSLIPLIVVTWIVLAATDTRAVQRFALAMMLALLVSYLCYAVAQSYVIRPTVTGGSWLDRSLREVYSLDKPYNDFPSLHTSQATIIALCWLRTHRRSGTVVAVWCALIVASTVLIHQHYLADVAAGLLVAWASFWAADHILTGLLGRRRP